MPTSKRQTAHDPRKPITREYVRTLRGRFKGKGLLKALMADRKKERELSIAQTESERSFTDDDPEFN